MLVALQQTGEDRPLPPAAEHVVALLRSWGPGPQHLPGLALAGITLPTRLGPRFVDALVFTRCGVVVIAAHEPGPPEWPGPGDRTGAVVAAAKGALAGHEGGRHVTGLVAVVPPGAGSRGSEAAPGGGLPGGGPEAVSRLAGPGVAGRAHETAEEHSPGNDSADPHSGGPAMAGPGSGSDSGGPAVSQLSEPAAATEARSTGPESDQPNSAAAEPAPNVSSREVTLPEDPAHPSVLHWPDPHPVPGVAVVLADPRGLRRIIAQHNRWRTVWSADDVLDACYALSLAHLAPPRAALIAEGFPARLPVLSRVPDRPAVIPVAPELPPPPAVVAEDEPTAWGAPARGPVSAAFPRQRPIRQVPWGLLFVLAVLVAVGVVAAVFVNQVFHGS